MIADPILAWRFARRELRGGLRGFGVFIACIAIGVAAIAGVGATSEAVKEGLSQDARLMHGGDIVIRTVHRRIETPDREVLTRLGRLSEGASLRAMARFENPTTKDSARKDRIQMVELKAVDNVYPVYGALDLAPPASLDDALARRDGIPGALADGALLEQIGATVGDRIRIGDASFEIRARILHEPDRGTRLFNFGPRLMVSLDALAETGLVLPGSLIRHYYRIALTPGRDTREVAESLADKATQEGWRVRRADQTAPGLRRTIGRVAVFMTFVGLTALLIGGIGVASAATAFLEGKTRSIAILKCLGAPPRLALSVFLIQFFVIATLAILAGSLVGAGVPHLLATLFADILPVRLVPGIPVGPVALAALFGWLTTLVFVLLPLARAGKARPAMLFRDAATPVSEAAGTGAWIALGIAVLTLVSVTVVSVDETWLALWFVGGAAVSFAALRLLTALLQGLARRLSPAAPPRWRLPLANLARPGAAMTNILFALGFSVAVLSGLALTEANFEHQVRRYIPKAAPTFFFLGIRSHQGDAFQTLLDTSPGVALLDRRPHLRARIVKINGQPTDSVQVAPETRWAVEGERSLTYADAPPAEARVIAGEWWPAGWRNEALISFDAALAEGFGIGIGDTLTFNVLGREIEGRIANLRRIDWSTLRMQFSTIFNVAALQNAPHSFIATAQADPDRETALLRATVDRFPNVSAVRVADALSAAAGLLERIGGAITIVAALGFVSGGIVAAGAAAAGQRRRIYDAVVLKVLGATRRDLLATHLLEFVLAGIAAAALGAGIGTAASWAVLTAAMGLEWTFLPEALATGMLAAFALTLAFGFVGTWRALGRKAAPLLRNS